MSKSIFPWVKPLGLSSSNFSEKPEGVSALVWGLKNNVINDQEYLIWATEHYQLPAIKAEFFSMAVDFTLIEKYVNHFDWHSYCYPIYQWEGTLFVACLEPPKVEIGGKTCFVIAPFHALESAWQKYENSKPGVASRTEQLPIAPEPSSTLAETDEIKSQAKQIHAPDITKTEVLAENASPIEIDAEVTKEQVIEIPEPAPAQEASTSEQAVPYKSEHNIDSSSLDFGDLKQEMGVDDDSPASAEAPAPGEHSDDQSVGELDFSNIGESEVGVSKEPAEEAAPKSEESQKEKVSAKEVTQTTVDTDLNQLTSATQTMHAANMTSTQAAQTKTSTMPFDNITIKGMSLEGEKTQVEPPKEEKTKAAATPPAPPQSVESEEVKQDAAVIIPPPPIETEQVAQKQAAPTPPQPPAVKDEGGLPSLDDLKAHQTENPQQAPGVEESSISLEKENQNTHPGQAFDDDYTPVPVITKAQQEAQARRKKEVLQKEQEEENSMISENTITDHSQPVLTPPENSITDEDLARADELENVGNMKLVVAHIFGHLKKDYEKLMWVEKESEGQFFVKYVYGEWKILQLAWKMHINITNPNIFRVAHKSGHPFHGEVYPNPYNEKYFEWWTRGKLPDFATVYPIKVDEEIVGFVAGFTKSADFDEVGSLKKIENLLAICKKVLTKFANAA